MRLERYKYCDLVINIVWFVVDHLNRSPLFY